MHRALLSAIFLLLFITATVWTQTDSVAADWDRRVVYTPEVSLPPEAAATGLSGVVRVPVTVDAAGTIVGVGEASGPGSVCSQVTRADVVALRRSAVEAARGARFAPISDGGPSLTRSWVPIEFGGTEGRVNVVDVFTAAAETPVPAEAEPKEPGKPRDPNKFTVKGDTNYSVSASSPPDYKGPVSVSKDLPPDRYVVAGDKHYSAANAPADGTAGVKTLSGGVLNGKAVTLTKPAYPPAARAVRATGAVSVQVLIDTNGQVFSAHAVSGHPLLRPATIPAACGSTFSPTLLQGEPVKVSGIITYNFVP